MSAAIRHLTATRLERRARAEREAREIANREQFLANAKGTPGNKGDKGERGDVGAQGPMPKHEWRGTKLKFEKPDGSWGKEVELRGPAGKAGTTRSVVASGGGHSGWTPDTLPAATPDEPDEFVVLQNGQWARATFAQMSVWFTGTSAPAHGYAIQTESGEFLLSESDDHLLQEAGGNVETSGRVATELGEALLTEFGGKILQEQV